MSDILVTAPKPGATVGLLKAGGKEYPCTLGRAGILPAAFKKEGDGATPAGIWPLRDGFYRADRLPQPRTGVLLRKLLPDDGWCEKIDHPDYNRWIKMPHPAVTDKMFRDDNVYDIIVVIGYNDAPVMAGRGSAIFMHLARPDFSPTAGCVGLALEHLQEVLVGLGPQSQITIREP